MAHIPVVVVNQLLETFIVSGARRLAAGPAPGPVISPFAIPARAVEVAGQADAAGERTLEAIDGGAKPLALTAGRVDVERRRPSTG